MKFVPFNEIIGQDGISHKRSSQTIILLGTTFLAATIVNNFLAQNVGNVAGRASEGSVATSLAI